MGIKYSTGKSDNAVTLEATLLYQQWAGYPDSPVLTTSYPYQVILLTSDQQSLFVTTKVIYLNGSFIICAGTFGVKYYNLNGETWNLIYQNDAYSGNIASFTEMYEANNDIFTDGTLTVVYFAKTTS